MRVLVAIAHHGSKNRSYLERMLAEFRSMPFEIDIVILSEAEKHVADDVEVRVGLPSDDPWSLPFAHRELFAERLEKYDLFVYSEDDTLIQRSHLEILGELTDLLPDDLIVGSLRYEVDGHGDRSYCSFHSHYHWEPTSLRRIAGLTFARFTNDHAAWYAVTQDQLRRAIDSGGFLVDPHEGDYDMLVSAATDIFTRCGFDRVLCLERIDELLVHHLPNVYLGQFGIDEDAFRAQVRSLIRLSDVDDQPVRLLSSETRLDSTWNRHTFMGVPRAIDELVPVTRSRILSLGAGSGAPETALEQAGHHVTTVAVDDVMLEVQRARGLHALSPNGWSANLDEHEPYDRVLLLDVLSYVEDPVALLRRLRPGLRSGGQLVVTAPNHQRHEWRNRLLRAGARPVPRSFTLDGIHWTSPAVVRSWLRSAGYDVVRTDHRSATRSDPFGVGGPRATMKGNSVAAWAALPGGQVSRFDSAAPG